MQSSLLPWGLIGLAIWFAYSALHIGVADILYPQEQPLQPHHWIFSMAPSQQQQRLERALTWTPSNPWYWQALGHVSLATQPTDTGRAARFFRHALAQMPTDPYLQLAWMTASRPHRSIALPTPNRADDPDLAKYTRVANLARSDPHVHYRIGVALGGRSAIPFFRHAMALNPSYYDKTLRTLLQNAPKTEAVLWFSRTIPNTAQGHDRAARLLEPISWPHARYHYLRAMALQNTNTELLHRFAVALQTHRDHRAAANIWRRLRSLTPDDAIVYGELADSYRHQGDFAQWRQTLRQRAERFPNEPAYRDQLADAYLQLGQPKEAHDIWQDLTRSQPQATVGYLGLAKLYTAEQREDKAIAMMKRVVDLAPGTIAHHRRLAQLYANTGATALARREYKRLVALRPNHPEALYHLGEHFRQAGDYARAIRYYQRAHTLAPKQAIYLYQLGRAHASRDEHQLAIEAYRQALSLNNNDYNAHYQLGLSYDTIGQSALAQRAYRQVVRLAPNPQAFPKACRLAGCEPTPSSIAGPHDTPSDS